MPLPSMSTFQRNAVALARTERQLFEDLVDVRKRTGQSSSAVAKKLDRHRSSVTRFENMQGDPRLSTILRYAAAVGAMIEIRVSEFPAWERSTRAAIESQPRANLQISPGESWGTWSNVAPTQARKGGTFHAVPLGGRWMGSR